MIILRQRKAQLAFALALVSGSGFRWCIPQGFCSYLLSLCIFPFFAKVHDGSAYRKTDRRADNQKDDVRIFHKV